MMYLLLSQQKLADKQISPNRSKQALLNNDFLQVKKDMQFWYL
jgi:hypothetical protein